MTPLSLKFSPVILRCGHLQCCYSQMLHSKHLYTCANIKLEIQTLLHSAINNSMVHMCIQRHSYIQAIEASAWYI